MHLMESRLADDRRLDLLDEAAGYRLRRADPRGRRHVRQRLGRWLVTVGERVEGAPVPCPAPAGC